ncbi:MAG: hypothetical protein BM562_12875 [Alphaproteobacteria bacterium MedPE-SWcel]|nr:MAG: hypothetical protein BM562_12875 [Alphaproteobacteria bacterium MedPE-SWcel]
MMRICPPQHGHGSRSVRGGAASSDGWSGSAALMSPSSARTRAIRQAEVGASRTMLDRTEKRFGIRPDWLAADTAYGNAENLGWLVEKRSIIPFIPVIDKSVRSDGTFSRSDFEWDEKNDQYICPEGHALKQFRRNYSDPNRGQDTGGRKKYRCLKATCQACPSKEICCPKADARYARGASDRRPRHELTGHHAALRRRSG